MLLFSIKQLSCGFGPGLN